MSRGVSILVITLGASEVQVFEKDLHNELFALDNSTNGKTIFQKFLKFFRGGKANITNNPIIKITHKPSGISLSLKKNRYYKDSFLLNSPRNDGKTVAENYEVFCDIIRMPLVEPFLKQHDAFDRVIVVFTNQASQEGVKEHFISTDTLFFESIFRQRFFPDYGDEKYLKVTVTRKVTDVDENYRLFASELASFIGQYDEIDSINLLAQGGIDQINHALTLQLLHQYRDKVKLFQVPELAGLKELRFSQLFLRDLTLKQVESLVSEFNYSGAMNLLDGIDKEILSEKNFTVLKFLILHARYRIEGLLSDAASFGRKSFPDGCPVVIQSFKNHLIPDNFLFANLFSSHSKANELAIKCANSFYVADSYLSIKDHTNFILNLAIFIERFLAFYIDSKFEGILNLSQSRKHEDEVKKLEKELAERFESFPETLIKNPFFREMTNFRFGPNIPSLLAASYALAQSDLEKEFVGHIIKLNSCCNNDFIIASVDSLRNAIAHRGEGVKEPNKKVVDYFENHIKKFFGEPYVNPFFEINQEIKTYINQLLKS